MRRVAIRKEQLRPEAVWDSYEFVRAALFAKKDSLLHACQAEPGTRPDPQFTWMTVGEVESHFADSLEEIEQQSCLSLLAATEAVIRVDFYRRVYGRRRDPVSKRFRQFFSTRKSRNGRKVRLTEILDAWASEVPANISSIGDFRGALRYRDWLAHGRYWVPKFGRRYYPDLVQEIIEDLLKMLGLA